jgi:RHS repeat-associated protein
VVRRHDFDAFGIQTTPGCGDAQQALLYTGQRRDPQNCLDDLGARAYRSDLGRLTSVDPATDVAGAQLDPQLWNRYAYAGNGPLSKTDPDGRSWKLATTVVKLAIKGGDIYSTVSDTVHAANIVFSQDEEVTAGDRVLAAGTILADLSGASDLLSIGRTAGRALRVIDDGRGAAK